MAGYATINEVEFETVSTAVEPVDERFLMTPMLTLSSLKDFSWSFMWIVWSPHSKDQRGKDSRIYIHDTDRIFFPQRRPMHRRLMNFYAPISEHSSVSYEECFISIVRIFCGGSVLCNRPRSFGCSLGLATKGRPLISPVWLQTLGPVLRCSSFTSEGFLFGTDWCVFCSEVKESTTVDERTCTQSMVVERLCQCPPWFGFCGRLVESSCTSFIHFPHKYSDWFLMFSAGNCRLRRASYHVSEPKANSNESHVVIGRVNRSADAPIVSSSRGFWKRKGVKKHSISIFMLSRRWDLPQLPESQCIILLHSAVVELVTTCSSPGTGWVSTKGNRTCLSTKNYSLWQNGTKAKQG